MINIALIIITLYYLFLLIFFKNYLVHASSVILIFPLFALFNYLSIKLINVLSKYFKYLALTVVCISVMGFWGCIEPFVMYNQRQKLLFTIINFIILYIGLLSYFFFAIINISKEGNSKNTFIIKEVYSMPLTFIAVIGCINIITIFKLSNYTLIKNSIITFSNQILLWCVFSYIVNMVFLYINVLKFGIKTLSIDVLLRTMPIEYKKWISIQTFIIIIGGLLISIIINDINQLIIWIEVIFLFLLMYLNTKYINSFNNIKINIALKPYSYVTFFMLWLFISAYMLLFINYVIKK